MQNLRPVAADALWIVSLQIAFAAVRAVGWWEDGPARTRAAASGGPSEAGDDTAPSGARGRTPGRDVWMPVAQRGGRGTAPLRMGMPALVLPRFTGLPGRRGIGSVGRAAVVGGAFLGVGSSPTAASPAVSGG